MFNSIDKTFLGAAGASVLASVLLWYTYDQSYGLFVGLWAPSILALWVGTRLALLAEHSHTPSHPEGGDS